jgi:putative transposase
LPRRRNEEPYPRKAIYTTNAYAHGGAKLYESMNMILREVLKNHRVFSTDESAIKFVYLAIANIAKKWTTLICD